MSTDKNGIRWTKSDYDDLVNEWDIRITTYMQNMDNTATGEQQSFPKVRIQYLGSERTYQDKLGNYRKSRPVKELELPERAYKELIAAGHKHLKK